MIPTAKVTCPMCKEDNYVDIFDIRRIYYMRSTYFEFVCEKCKTKLTITPDEFENNRIDA